MNRIKAQLTVFLVMEPVNSGSSSLLKNDALIFLDFIHDLNDTFTVMGDVSSHPMTVNKRLW